jgi:dihydrofolate reductase
MGRLIYLMNVSLDGYIETTDHSLDWTTVDEELHTWFNDRSREMDASLYGRRMYEVMAPYWPTVADDPEATPAMLEYGKVWEAVPRIVFSRTLTEVSGNSRLATLEPAEELARIRAEFPGDLEVSGPTLAAEFIRQDLVDEYWLVVHPVFLGSGTPYFPNLDQPRKLRLLDTHRFTSGADYLRYTAR